MGNEFASFNKSKPYRILIIASNPGSTEYARLDEEIKEIQGNWRSSTHRDSFELSVSLAATLDDFSKVLTSFQPHLLFFTGHATDEGLKFHDENQDGEKTVPNSGFLSIINSSFAPPPKPRFHMVTPLMGA